MRPTEYLEDRVQISINEVYRDHPRRLYAGGERRLGSV